jgi:aspartate/methionine/tyrosine aminotransferase
MNASDFPFPLDSEIVDGFISDAELELDSVSIRELRRLVDRISSHFGIDFLRFEFGIPGLKAERIGPEEEIRILREDDSIPSTYPPFDGIPRLKEATRRFVRMFMNIDVAPENCIPTVGAMQGCLISQAITGRRREEADTIAYLDPGFPVNKLQTKFLGLRSKSIDLYDCRGENLLRRLEEIFSSGCIGALLWSNPNNPAWICLKENELAGIGKLLTEYDVIGIEDQAYFGMDFRFDYSVPGAPPFQPTVARFTENYIIVLSSSKIFSYAGQRVAVAVISPGLMKRRYPGLKRYCSTEVFGHAFVHGGIYPTTAGVSQTPQHALAALFEAACDGSYRFIEKVRRYGERGKKVKQFFLMNGFELLYSEDLGEPIGDGFYFTIRREHMTGSELVYHMLRFGLSAIPLKPTGASREGARICVSLIHEDQFEVLDRRIAALNSYLSSHYDRGASDGT